MDDALREIIKVILLPPTIIPSDSGSLWMELLKTILPALIAAAITIVGVIANNNSLAQRQREQMDSLAQMQRDLIESQGNLQREQIVATESQQKTEREMAIRRDIYFAGAEAFGRMHSFLSTVGMPQIDGLQRPVNVGLDGINEAIYKVAVIASLEILTKLDELQLFFGESWMELQDGAQACDQKIEETRRLEKSSDHISAQLSQLTAELNAAIQQKDATMQSTLRARYQTLLGSFDKTKMEARDLMNDSAKLVMVATEQTVRVLTRFEEIAGELNCLVRAELGFEIDQEEYLDLIKKSADLQRERLRRRHQEIKEQHGLE